MPIGQAQDMLSQLMQQLMSGGFAQQSAGQLDQMGASKINAKKAFRMPDDEGQLRQAVLGRMLNYYGGGQQQQGSRDVVSGLVPPNLLGPQQFGGFGDMTETFGTPGIQKGTSGNPMYMPPGTPQTQNPITGEGYRPFPGGASSMQDMLSQAWEQSQGGQAIGSTNPLSGGQQQSQAQQFILGQGLPELGPGMQGALDRVYQPQMDSMNMDFENQKTGLLENLFGKGMAQSTPATDAGGKLLYGRSAAMNQIQGQKAQQEIELRKGLMDQLSKMNPTAFTGGGGGSSLPGGMGIADNPSGPMLSAVMSQISGSDRPLNFEQAMQQQEMQLKRDQLTQQGALGFGGLDLQRMLGLGGQDIQRQGMGQDLMSQLLGMGLSRQQSQAGLQSSEAARLQQFLLGQQGIQAGIGSQQAQMEAQKKSLLGSILSGVLGGGASLLGAAGSAGGFGSLFR